MTNAIHTALKKKNSKTGDDSRLQGTVLGNDPEPRSIKIEGGPESIGQWHQQVQEKQSKLGVIGRGNAYADAAASLEDENEDENEDIDMVG